MNYEEWQRQLRDQKHAERQKKNESANILRTYRGGVKEDELRLRAQKEEERKKKTESEQLLRGYRGNVNEEDLKLSALRQEERKKQQAAENLLRSYTYYESTPDQKGKQRVQKKDVQNLPPPVEINREEDLSEIIRAGSVSAAAASFDKKKKETVGTAVTPNNRPSTELNSLPEDGSDTVQAGSVSEAASNFNSVAPIAAVTPESTPATRTNEESVAVTTDGESCDSKPVEPATANPFDAVPTESEVAPQFAPPAENAMLGTSESTEEINQQGLAPTGNDEPVPTEATVDEGKEIVDEPPESAPISPPFMNGEESAGQEQVVEQESQPIEPAVALEEPVVEAISQPAEPVVAVEEPVVEPESQPEELATEAQIPAVEPESQLADPTEDDQVPPSEPDNLPAKQPLDTAPEVPDGTGMNGETNELDGTKADPVFLRAETMRTSLTSEAEQTYEAPSYSDPLKQLQHTAAEEMPLTGHPTVVRLDVLFSFGLVTPSTAPVLGGYMMAVEEIVRRTIDDNPHLAEFMKYDPGFAPFVRDCVWDSSFSDPSGRPYVNRALVTAAVPIFLSNGISIADARRCIIAGLQTSIQTGSFLELAQIS